MRLLLILDINTCLSIWWWRSRDELISDVLLWTPTHGHAKAGRPARAYIQQLCEDTGCCPEDLPEAMNDREMWRERVKDIRATSTTWWWWSIWYHPALARTSAAATATLPVSSTLALAVTNVPGISMDRHFLDLCFMKLSHQWIYKRVCIYMWLCVQKWGRIRY